MRKELGQIKSATFGMGGYQECMFGLSLTFGGVAWGAGSFTGAWAIERSDGAKWTEQDRRDQILEASLLLMDTLKKAKRDHVAQLVGTPVEVTFEGNLLKSWRVLEEVLA